ncbi:hypothetical protein QCA50_012629 [Cerrena zonata]|uniref:JmjC domain-containing protein n=1 Tax=Cerrena zonata TaxID=2478898 RepID=A0AAW0FZM7_9APHY
MVNEAGPSNVYMSQHPAWPYPDCDLYQAGLEMAEFPSTAGHIVWPSGIRTALPFLPSTEESISTDGVKKMAAGKDDLLLPRHDRIAAIVDLGSKALTPMETIALNRWIRKMLGDGRLVVLHNTPMTSQIPLTEDGFVALRSDLDKRIDVLEELADYNRSVPEEEKEKARPGRKSKGKGRPSKLEKTGKKAAGMLYHYDSRHVRCEYMQIGKQRHTHTAVYSTDTELEVNGEESGSIHRAFENPDRVGPHVSLTIREFIRCRTNHHFCGNWLDSATVFCSGSPMFIQGISDDSIAAASIMSTNSESDERRQPFSQDWVRCKSWSIAAHATSFTSFHHDSNGLCTWALVLSGLKFWGYVVTVDGIVEMKKRGELDSEMFTESPPMYSMRQGHVVLTVGSTVIMPPGLLHTVFTALSSVMNGGHFYCYDTMAATEMAMRFDKEKTAQKTNNHHPSYIAIMVRMVLAMPSIFKEMVPYDTICAFGAILGDPTFYKLQEFSGMEDANVLSEVDEIDKALLHKARNLLLRGLVKSNEVQEGKAWKAISTQLRKSLDEHHHKTNKPSNLYMRISDFR